MSDIAGHEFFLTTLHLIRDALRKATLDPDQPVSDLRLLARLADVDERIGRAEALLRMAADLPRCPMCGGPVAI